MTLNDNADNRGMGFVSAQHMAAHGRDAFVLMLQVPELIFITDKLPKGATGKIQRRHMPAAFLGDKNKKKAAGGSTDKKASGGGGKQPTVDKDSGKPLIYSKL